MYKTYPENCRKQKHVKAKDETQHRINMGKVVQERNQIREYKVRINCSRSILKVGEKPFRALNSQDTAKNRSHDTK